MTTETKERTSLPDLNVKAAKADRAVRDALAGLCRRWRPGSCADTRVP